MERISRLKILLLNQAAEEVCQKLRSVHVGNVRYVFILHFVEHHENPDSPFVLQIELVGSCLNRFLKEKDGSVNQKERLQEVWEKEEKLLHPGYQEKGLAHASQDKQPVNPFPDSPLELPGSQNHA